MEPDTNIKFKIGDRVRPKPHILELHPNDVTKGKVYIVEKYVGFFDSGSGTRVQADNGDSYWSDPEQYFELIRPNIQVGGLV